MSFPAASAEPYLGIRKLAALPSVKLMNLERDALKIEEAFRMQISDKKNNSVALNLAFSFIAFKTFLTVNCKELFFYSYKTNHVRLGLPDSSIF